MVWDLDALVREDLAYKFRDRYHERQLARRRVRVARVTGEERAVERFASYMKAGSGDPIVLERNLT